MRWTSASKARYAHNPYASCIKPKDVGGRGSCRRLDAGADATVFRDAARSCSPSLRQADLAPMHNTGFPSRQSDLNVPVDTTGGDRSGVSTTSISGVLESWRSSLLFADGAQSS
jgi:hypothetical protein